MAIKHLLGLRIAWENMRESRLNNSSLFLFLFFLFFFPLAVNITGVIPLLKADFMDT